MTPFFGRVRQQIFGISRQETTFAQRGFYSSDRRSQQHLEQIGNTFLFGYHAVLVDDRPDVIAHQIDQVEIELRGFAFEGAAMGLALLDVLTPWRRNRLQGFLQGSGSDHLYMVHVGVGWVLARLHLPIYRSLQRLDPLLGWLAIDGYGFHEGYFHWHRYLNNQSIPKALSGYACRAFDQGLGRSLWFVKGADVREISATISNFSVERHADLWNGIGLACAYAGGADRLTVEALRSLAQLYQPQLAQGAAFAAKARQRAGNPAAHTELACRILCGLPATEAAEVTDTALEQLPSDGVEPAYEIWRQRIQAHFIKQEVKV